MASKPETADPATTQATQSGVVYNPADAFGLVKWFGSVLVDRFTDPDAARGLRVSVTVSFEEVAE